MVSGNNCNKVTDHNVVGKYALSSMFYKPCSSSRTGIIRYLLGHRAAFFKLEKTSASYLS